MCWRVSEIHCLQKACINLYTDPVCTMHVQVWVGSCALNVAALALAARCDVPKELTRFQPSHARDAFVPVVLDDQLCPCGQYVFSFPGERQSSDSMTCCLRALFRFSISHAAFSILGFLSSCCLTWTSRSSACTAATARCSQDVLARSSHFSILSFRRASTCIAMLNARALPSYLESRSISRELSRSLSLDSLLEPFSVMFDSLHPSLTSGAVTASFAPRRATILGA